MLKGLVVVFLALCVFGAWLVYPIAMEDASGWCARVNSYAYGERVTHDGDLPWAASVRVNLSTCGDSDGSHATYR